MATPDHGPSSPARTRAAVGSAALLAGVLGLNTIGLVLGPGLFGGHELLLVALRPTPMVLVLVGGRLDPLLVMLVAIPTRLLLDLSYFLAARHSGLAVLARTRWAPTVLRPASRPRSVRTLQRVALLYASAPVDIALGLGPTRPGRFLAVASVGTTLSTLFYLLVATSVSRPASGVVDWVARHCDGVTVAIVVGLAAGAALVVRRRRNGQQPQGPSAPDR